MNTINRTRVERIKDLMRSEDPSLPSWRKYYKDDYEVADAEIVAENAEIRKAKIDSILAELAAEKADIRKAKIDLILADTE